MPENVEVMVAHAELFAVTDRTSEAIQMLEKAQKAAPDRTPIRIALVDLHLRAGDGETAHALARKIVLDERTSFPATVALARTELAVGRREDAVNTLTAAARMKSPTVTAEDRFRLGMLQIDAKDIAGARASLERAIEENARFLPAYEAARRRSRSRERRADAALAVAAKLDASLPDNALGDVPRWRCVRGER